MSVYSFYINFPGETNIVPRLGRLYAPNNTLAEVTAAGYLDSYLRANSVSLLPTDVVCAVASNGSQWYRPSFSGDSVQLVALG